MNSDGQEFGILLRACRQTAGLSQEELAERSGLSLRSISNLERGRTRWPYRETLHRLADALELHDAARAVFIGAACRRLAAITGVLSASPARDQSRPADDPLVPPLPVPAPGILPRQLPCVAIPFVGRVRELAALDSLVDEADSGTGGTIAISVIAGTAGVGKTALALYWAHSAARGFPDGQLYANLRGYDQSGIPASADEIMRGFLHAMQVDYMRLPATLDEQAGMYRSLLAGKRMLVLLDNVLDADQVRPLLPGSPGCLVVVTSRSQLLGLVTLNGARLINLDVLSEPEASDLFAARLGANRTGAESGAVGELARFCARLPLALCITAARAAIHPEMPLSALAVELKNAGSPLDVLNSAEPGADIRTVFSWSYNNLDHDASRVFRLLSLHPGPDLGVPAAASLVGRPVRAARTALRNLANAGLITEHAPGRYALHDLLRTYSSEQVCRAETDGERRRAMSRLLDHYLHSARAADEALYPARWSVIFEPRVADTVTEEFAGKEQAYAWLDAERLILLKLIDQAARSGFDAYSWRLAWIIRRFLNARGYPNEMLATQRTALAAACRIGDLEGQAHIHLGLGRACTDPR